MGYHFLVEGDVHLLEIFDFLHWRCRDVVFAIGVRRVADKLEDFFLNLQYFLFLLVFLVLWVLFLVVLLFHE